MESTPNLAICSKCALTPICKNQPQQSCSYFQLKGEPVKSAIIYKKAPMKPLAFLGRLLYTLLMWFVVLALMAGAFFVGRASQTPQFQSLLPQVDPPSVLDPPDKIVERVFTAAAVGNVEQVISYFHPASLSRYWAAYNEQVKGTAGIFAPYKQVSVIQAENEDAVTLLVSVTELAGVKRSYSIALKKHQGQWKIMALEPKAS